MKIQRQSRTPLDISKDEERKNDYRKQFDDINNLDISYPEKQKLWIDLYENFFQQEDFVKDIPITKETEEFLNQIINEYGYFAVALDEKGELFATILDASYVDPHVD